MKISRIVDLHADAGWRVFSFLKIETDAGLIGWSEYNESYGSKGLTVVIMKLAEMLIGQDPRPVELITANLYARTRQAPGGLIQQAIAAIENALVDVKAKALGVPVCEMLGGPVRDRLRLYWSHCGTYRLHPPHGPPSFALERHCLAEGCISLPFGQQDRLRGQHGPVHAARGAHLDYLVLLRG